MKRDENRGAGRGVNLERKMGVNMGGNSTGYAAEFIFFKEQNPKLRVKDVTQIIFDPNEGTGDVSKALNCINA